ncbi:expressed unknown protein [Seminavis robusta]|uniref:Uncharacterized protein n=1 Tax=Seminavis robusta TaxID=568900 RepID=A0A9N8EAG5_9STRA|nr:expressed unknown protein [Seminavis robusta]|eukprot:Sro687_g187320.1 n/a (163) ;mRNA; f:51493-51981
MTDETSPQVSKPATQETAKPKATPELKTAKPKEATKETAKPKETAKIQQPTDKPKQVVDPTIDLVDRLVRVFDDARDKAEVLQEATARLDVVKDLITGTAGKDMAEADKEREIAKLVDAAFQDSDRLRKSWRIVIEHPGLKGVEDGVTPQMSMEMDTRQTKG